MQYHDFKGEKISRLGFGLMRLPVFDNDQSKIDYDKTEEMVLYAFEHGVNYFDTAYPYHNGFSEKTLGKIMSENKLRGKINVATKLLTMGMNKPEYDPRKIFEEQLNRLQTDKIDFYLVHGLRKGTWETLRDKWQAAEWLRDLRDQGVIRHLGFSFHDDFDTFRGIIEDFDWEFAQIQYNYVDNEIQAGDKGIAFADEKGLPLIVMEPLKGGNLVFTDNPEVDEIKARHGLSDLSGARLGLAYVFNNPSFFTVLSGMNSMEQVKENIEIASDYAPGCLTDEMASAINDIRGLVSGAEGIPCTTCRYCLEGCPAKIQIPIAFKLYNNGKRFKNIEAQKRSYERDCKNLADCIECGQCVDVCPQHLEIPQLLKQVREFLE